MCIFIYVYREICMASSPTLQWTRIFFVPCPEQINPQLVKSSCLDAIRYPEDTMSDDVDDDDDDNLTTQSSSITSNSLLPVVVDIQTDQQTDRPTDRRTYQPTYSWIGLLQILPYSHQGNRIRALTFTLGSLVTQRYFHSYTYGMGQATTPRTRIAYHCLQKTFFF